MPLSQSVGSGIHRLKATGPVTFGTMSIDMDPTANFTSGLGGKEKVEITFDPDPGGPHTDRINFFQIARTEFVDKKTWGEHNPAEKQIDSFTTSQADGDHRTAAGNTLASIAKQHYGDPDKALDVYNANTVAIQTGKNIGWPVRDAEPAPQPPTAAPDMKAALPVGLHLVIPKAVQAGYHMDIDVKDKQRRLEKTDPNVSPKYPHMKNDFKPALGFFAPSFGFNHGLGDVQPATMTDLPGGGVDPVVFSFESAAHAEDIGVSYGSVQWGFRYTPLAITAERAKVVPGTSDTVRAATRSLNEYYRNKHVAQAGETLNSIAVLYYGNTNRMKEIIRMNPSLPSPDPAAALPAGTQLELPSVGPTMWDLVREGGKRKEKVPG